MSRSIIKEMKVQFLLFHLQIIRFSSQTSSSDKQRPRSIWSICILHCGLVMQIPALKFMDMKAHSVAVNCLIRERDGQYITRFHFHRRRGTIWNRFCAMLWLNLEKHLGSNYTLRTEPPQKVILWLINSLGHLKEK